MKIAAELRKTPDHKYLLDHKYLSKTSIRLKLRICSFVIPFIINHVQTNQKRLINSLILIVFCTYVGQFLLNAAIAPLARQMGIKEWQVGATISLAALMVTLLSQRWGRASISLGRKPVLLASLVLASVAGLSFAFTTYLRLHGLISAALAAFGIITARGFFFGAAVAAVPPTGQALIAELTPKPKDRIRAMAAFSASVNIAGMVGALLSGLLASISLFTPVVATPIAILIGLIIAIFALPSTPKSKQIEKVPKLVWHDERLFPYIAAGFGQFFAIGVFQVIMGFIVQDRYQINAQQAVFFTGLLMLTQAIGVVFAQLVVVPKLIWRPQRLIRVGLLITIVFGATLLLVVPLPILFIFSICTGFGAGLFNPGYNAGASISVKPTEQAGTAGLLSATGGFTWIFAPLLGTSLYGINPQLAIGLAVSATCAATLLAWWHPRLRPRRYTLNLRTLPIPQELLHAPDEIS